MKMIQKMVFKIRCNQCNMIIEDGIEGDQFTITAESHNGIIVAMQVECPWGHKMEIPLKPD